MGYDSIRLKDSQLHVCANCRTTSVMDSYCTDNVRLTELINWFSLLLLRAKWIRTLVFWPERILHTWNNRHVVELLFKLNDCQTKQAVRSCYSTWELLVHKISEIFQSEAARFRMGSVEEAAWTSLIPLPTHITHIRFKICLCGAWWKWTDSPCQLAVGVCVGVCVRLFIESGV